MRSTSSTQIKDKLTKAKPAPTDVEGILALLNDNITKLDEHVKGYGSSEHTDLQKLNVAIVDKLKSYCSDYMEMEREKKPAPGEVAKEIHDLLSLMLRISEKKRGYEVKHTTYAVSHGNYEETSCDSRNEAENEASRLGGFVSESTSTEKKVAPDPFANTLIELQKSIQAVQEELEMNVKRVQDLIAEGDRLVKQPGYLSEAKQCYTRALELNGNLNNEQVAQEVKNKLTLFENVKIPVNLTNVNKEQVLDILKVMPKEASVKLMEKVLYGQDANDDLKGFFWRRSGLTSCDLSSGTLKKMKAYYDGLTAA